MVPTSEHWRPQKWAHERGAIPGQIQRLNHDGEPATLTFLFSKASGTGPHICAITWEMFFAQFDLLKLSMAFDDTSLDYRIVKVSEPCGFPLN